MYNKKMLIFPIIQLVIGLLAIAAYIIITINEGFVFKWTITLLLAVFYVVFGIIEIIEYIKNR